MQVHECAQPGALQLTRGARLFKHMTEQLDREESDNPQDPGDQELAARRWIIDQFGDQKQRRDGQHDLECLDVAELLERFLDHLDPVMLLIGIKEEFEPDQQQERAAKAHDPGMRAFDDVLVIDRLFDRQPQRLDRTDLGRDRDDQQREQDPHPEHRDQHAPGEKALLPDRIHVLEHHGVHHGIVERQRYFEHRQHQADPGRRQCRGCAAGAETQPGGQGQADQREHRAASEILQHVTQFLCRRHSAHLRSCGLPPIGRQLAKRKSLRGFRPRQGGARTSRSRRSPRSRRRG